MDFQHYQNATDSTAIYPGAGSGSPAAVNYAILGLAGEAGEIANAWKKFYRDGIPSDVMYARIRSELGDLLWYAARLAMEMGSSLDEVALDNLDKLESRKKDGTLTGSGDYR